MRILTLTVALALAACGGKTTPPATDNQTDQPDPDPSTGSPLAADGQHFAADRVYEGDCAPPGSRGGCHTITLRADGTADNFLFDANVPGTYQIDDHTLTMTSADGGTTEPMTFSEDYGKLDTLDLKAP